MKKKRDEKDQSPVSLLSDEIKRPAKMTSVINLSWPLKKEVSNPETNAMNLDFRKPLNVTTPHSSVNVSKRRNKKNTVIYLWYLAQWRPKIRRDAERYREF